jgi:hypothetical protein
MGGATIPGTKWPKRKGTGPSRDSEESGLPKQSKSELSNKVASSKENGVESKLQMLRFPTSLPNLIKLYW